ncbi:hypothetical protein ACFL26_00755 [Patescibacteria group bacterium]
MRKLALFLALAGTLALAACTNYAPGVRGGIVRAGSEEAVPERHEPTFFYDGERGTHVGVYTPDYVMNVMRFSNASLHFVTSEGGWEFTRFQGLIVMRHEEMDATVILQPVPYADMAVAREYQTSRRDAEVTLGPLAFNDGVRHDSHFTYARPGPGIYGMVYGLQTNLRDERTGIIAVGGWSQEHDETLREELPRMMRRAVILFRD